MIKSKQNKKITPINVSFGTLPQVGISLINISFDNQDFLYPNKKIKILTDTNFVLNGTLKTNGITYKLLLDTPLITGNEFLYGGFYYDSFLGNISDDSIIPSLLDIYRLQTTPDLFENDILIEKGSIGLLNGFDKFKIDNQKIELKYTTFDIISPINNLFGVIAINGKNINHVFKVKSKNLSIELQLNIDKLNIDSLETSNQNYSIYLNNFSVVELYKNIKLNLSLRRIFSNDGENDYIAIYGKFENVGTESIDVNIYHNVFNISDVSLNVPIFVDQTDQYLTYNKQEIYNNSYVDVFEITNNIIGYNYNGKIENIKQNIFIPDGTDLSYLRNPGIYYKHTGNISSIISKPISNNQRFTLIVENYNQSSNSDLYLLQKYSCYKQIGTTTNFQIVTFERVSHYISGSFVWSPWLEVSLENHTHQGSQIIQSPLYRLVTDTQINSWNQGLTTNTTWKSPVSTISQLSSLYPSPGNGWCVYVLETDSIHIFNGSTWVNQKAYASLTQDGIITKFDYTNLIANQGLSKKVNNKKSYIHRLTESDEFIYGTNFSNINNNHIDHVERTSQLVGQLKEFTIQQGWNVTSYGSNSYITGKDILSNYDNSIGIGTGLEYTAENQLFFGKFNIGNGNLFAIGNGTSNSVRSNLFAIKNDGVAVASGYATKTGTINDILLANGSTISKTNLLQGIYNDIALAGTEVVEINTILETYTLEWNESRIINFGRFGKFEVWLKTSDNVWSFENVPIRMITQNNDENLVQAVSYTFTLSGLYAIILIK